MFKEILNECSKDEKSLYGLRQQATLGLRQYLCEIFAKSKASSDERVGVLL